MELDMNILHKDEIIALLTRRPDLRVNQISDALDIDLEEISIDVVAMLDSRLLVATPHAGVQGTTMLYRVNPNSLAWQAPNITDDARAKKAPSKFDLAVAYLKEHGSASASELGQAIGIDTKKYSPSQYLAIAIKSGSIVRDGNLYTLGGMSERPIKTATPTSNSSTTFKSIADKVQKAKKPALSSPLNAVTSSMSIGNLQIIVWGQGNLTLSANDNTVELLPTQVKALTAFVGLMEASHGQA
jgi:hypothetical protein